MKSQSGEEGSEKVRLSLIGGERSKLVREGGEKRGRGRRLRRLREITWRGESEEEGWSGESILVWKEIEARMSSFH